MGCNQVKVYNDSDTPLIHKLDWMKEIPDDTKLSQMTIPGTHDSCSLFGICCARTQTWSLVEQMRAGLRYFDIRLRRIDDTLRAYHGFVDEKETFDKILVYALDFLEKNPSETIIMEIISEYDPKNSTKSFRELYGDYTRTYIDKIVSYNNRDITLGEIRGKLFVVKVFEGSTSRIPNFLIQNCLK
jgi:1-phosphatidylinositol phosphodiesterase